MQNHELKYGSVICRAKESKCHDGRGIFSSIVIKRLPAAGNEEVS